MRDQLNARVKHREAFRPFAAFIMFEHQNAWLEHSFYAPTMEAVFKVRSDKQALIPAVVHYDQSCRIQSVRKEIQPFIWSLLDLFHKKTGVPMLINTSFNDSEPVVCTEDDALSCFLHCDMDHVVFDNRVISKK
jgi:carbamoyltransferase